MHGVAPYERAGLYATGAGGCHFHHDTYGIADDGCANCD
jgi:hypothetical protein